MKLLRYAQFINEANTPVFSFDAPNYAPKTVAQSLPFTPHDKDLPRHTERPANGPPIENSMMYSEFTGKYYSSSEIREVLRKYFVWAKQNGETQEYTEISDGRTLDYVLKKIQDNKEEINFPD